MKAPKLVKKAQAGFTLIELMIVVAIIGILAAVAIPAYNDYTQKAQMSEAFSEVGGMQTAIVAFAQENGAYPSDTDITAGVGASVTGKYSTAATTAATGVITVTMNSTGVGADIQGKKVQFTPPTLAGAVNFLWICKSNAAQKYIPKTCEGGATIS